MPRLYNVNETRHAVVIAGAGPTGLMLAGELALAGIDVAIVERRADQNLIGRRAGGLLSRTIEVLDQRGIADRFLSEGKVHHVTGFAWIRLDISDVPSRHNYVLALGQKHIERILSNWIEELAVPIYRGREVTGFTQDEAGVSVQFADGEPLRAQYLVGCDGGRSRVRKAAHIGFAGSKPTTSTLIAEVEITGEPQWGTQHNARGVHAFSRLDDGPVGVMVTEQRTRRTGKPSLAELREALVAVFGTDYGVHSPTSISRFTDMARLATTYRKGRVLLAGDAAHVHSPVGGQGLNTGVQDAVNLGWKLAQVLNRKSPESLLDTYHAERHPVAARVLRATMAQTVLLRKLDDPIKALRDTMQELLSMEEPRRKFGAMMSGLDVAYGLGNAHPLLGRRMPDLDVRTARGSQRVFTLLHDARSVLLNFGERDIDAPPWADRVKVVNAGYEGNWELPALAKVTAPTAVLIRPDGHVAWVGDGTDLGLADALAIWCGSPATAL